MSGRLESRFWAKCVPEPNTGCWLWSSAFSRDGYGVFGVYREQDRQRLGLHTHNARAHRVAWALHSGSPVADGEVVCHRCDNPACVNPDHLWLGTPFANTRDMHAKGRAARPTARLTVAQVEKMRRLYVSGARTADLGRMFNVQRDTVGAIVRGLCWRGAGGPTVKRLRNDRPDYSGPRNPNYRHGRYAKTGSG